MNDEQVVELGTRAEALLNSQTMRYVVNHLAQQYQNEIFTSKPEERQKREQFYYLNRALSDIVAQLDQYRVAKDAVLERLEKEDKE